SWLPAVAPPARARHNGSRASRRRRDGRGAVFMGVPLRGRGGHMATAHYSPAGARVQGILASVRLPVMNERELLRRLAAGPVSGARSEEHTSELQSRENLVCRLLLE